METNPNANIDSLINPLEKYKIEEYLIYLKCSKCLDLMLEPKTCITCSKVLCSKCHKSNCNHPLITSRHIKSILENMYFKCKYNKDGCIATMNYLGLKRHAEACEFFKKNERSMDMVNRSIALNNTTEEKPKSSIKELAPVSISQKMNYSPANISFSCECGEKFNTSNSDCKKIYLNHKRECMLLKTNNNQEENVNKLDAKSKKCLVDDFLENLKRVKETYIEVSSQKDKFYIDQLKNNIEILNKNFNDKSDKISNMETELNNHLQIPNHNKCKVPDKILKNDDEYQRLESQKAKLTSAKEKLEQEYLRLTNNALELQQKGENDLNKLAEIYRRQLYQYDLEEQWIKEEIANYNPELLYSAFLGGDGCSKCHDGNPKQKKFFCQECRKRYCAGKCAKVCKTPACLKISKFICPMCYPPCGLCRRNQYCDTCRVRCFYENCKNRFCPECFKRNSHQSREKNIDCKFFSCERCSACDCLMSYLFCQKCDKRLCNNCVFTEKKHFPFLLD